MPKYVIEREIPGIGASTADELAEGARRSNAVLTEMGPSIQWVHSYVVDDMTYCVYIAPNEDAIREHARKSGFPVTKIARIATTIDPTTGE